ncbi:MAG TPA: hypothetical protein VFR70_09620 [Flavobacterium sp.]|nr:hypothetical protein [Flavobacterium sp.]
MRKYAYAYDPLNRLLDAAYSRPGASINSSYGESLGYDANGNITSLVRYGELDDNLVKRKIDNLAYAYAGNSNQLAKVTDNEADPSGFADGTNTGDDYAYDAYGNMIEDKNKGITAIAYNHLNLPVKIVFGSQSQRIEYLYAADGRKLRKLVPYQNPQLQGGYGFTAMEYIDGFQYQDGSLKFFPTAEGYVQKTLSVYSYVYNYTDHLGNVRLSYGVDPATQAVKIIEENHYYPFGLKHNNYNSTQLQFSVRQESVVLRAKAAPANPAPVLGYGYKYQGQERQDELGLNWDSFKWRNYDYGIGRFFNIDPLAEDYAYQSTYAFAENKVISHRELEGLEGVWFQAVMNADKAANPNGVSAHVLGFAEGLGNVAKGIVNAISDPIGTAKSIGNAAIWVAVGSQGSESVDNFLGTNSSGAGDSILNGIYNSGNALINGDGLARGNVIGEITGTVVAGELVGVASGKLGTLGKGTATEASAVKAIGPAGDASASVTQQIPGGWTMKTSKNGQGTTFSDPVNPKANNVRVQSGNPKSPNAAQQSPYVKQTVNGKTVNSKGQPVNSNSPAAHIPKKDFKFN